MFEFRPLNKLQFNSEEYWTMHYKNLHYLVAL